MVSLVNDPNWADIAAQVGESSFVVDNIGLASNYVANIKYSNEYIELMGLFWCVYQAGEQSPRVFELTTRIIGLCEGHYTVWQYRRKLLRAWVGEEEGSIDLHQELAFIRQYTVERPKNYQLWRHREVVVGMIESNDGVDKGLIDAELDDLVLVLMDEPKNYHAWQYRQWLVKRFDVWEGELKFTDDMLTMDPYNNSAWNYRYFVNFSRENTVDWRREIHRLSTILRECTIIGNRSLLNYAHSLSALVPGRWGIALLETLRESPAHYEEYCKLYQIKWCSD